MRILVVLCAIVIASGCAGVSSRPTAYTSLGRVVEKVGDTVAIRSSPPQGLVLPGKPSLGTVVAEVLVTEILPQPTYKFDFQRYWVLLETGQKVSLRSRRDDISVGECTRVWIDAPDISSIYLYTPDMSEIDKAQGCKE